LNTPSDPQRALQQFPLAIEIPELLSNDRKTMKERRHCRVRWPERSLCKLQGLSPRVLSVSDIALEKQQVAVQFRCCDIMWVVRRKSEPNVRRSIQGGHCGIVVAVPAIQQRFQIQRTGKIERSAFRSRFANAPGFVESLLGFGEPLQPDHRDR